MAVGLLRSCHPAPSAAVTAFAVALSLAVGRSVAGVVLAGAAVAAGQLSVGWHNDWLDASRDEVSGRSDKPVALGAVSRALVGRAAGLAVAAVIPLSLANGWRAGLAHLAAVALAWGYNWRWKATVWSWVPYAGAFALLAAFVTLGLPVPRWPPWWALVAAALLGVGAHLANAAPDLAQDLAGGIRGLPHILGYRRSVLAATEWGSCSTGAPSREAQTVRSTKRSPASTQIETRVTHDRPASSTTACSDRPSSILTPFSR